MYEQVRSLKCIDGALDVAAGVASYSLLLLFKSNHNSLFHRVQMDSEVAISSYERNGYNFEQGSARGPCSNQSK